jgi:hypothetical protein
VTWPHLQPSPACTSRPSNTVEPSNHHQAYGPRPLTDVSAFRLFPQPITSVSRSRSIGHVRVQCHLPSHQTQTETSQDDSVVRGHMPQSFLLPVRRPPAPVSPTYCTYLQLCIALKSIVTRHIRGSLGTALRGKASGAWPRYRCRRKMIYHFCVNRHPGGLPRSRLCHIACLPAWSLW